MPTLARFALSMIACGALLFTGCKKTEEEPQAVPLPSAPAPVKATPETQQAAQGSAEGAVAGSAGSAAAAPMPVAPPPTEAPKPVAQASIDGCCAALSGIGKSGLPAAVKSKAAVASATCAGIAKLVKEGKTSRASALAQINATMGGTAPSECK